MRPRRDPKGTQNWTASTRLPDLYSNRLYLAVDRGTVVCRCVHGTSRGGHLGSVAIGPKILPAFRGARVLYSPELMFLSLILLCLLRVLGDPYAGVGRDRTNGGDDLGAESGGDFLAPPGRLMQHVATIPK